MRFMLSCLLSHDCDLTELLLVLYPHTRHKPVVINRKCTRGKRKAKKKIPEVSGNNAHLNIQLWLNRKSSICFAMTTNQSQSFGQNMRGWKRTIPELFLENFCRNICSNKANQRTNGPVNAHLISWYKNKFRQI